MVAAYVAKHLGVTEEISSQLLLTCSHKEPYRMKKQPMVLIFFRRLQCQSNSYEAHFGDLLSHS